MFGGLAESEDCRSKLADRVVEVGDRVRDPFGHHRGLGLALNRLEAHTGREQALDHHVVEIAGDPFTILQHRHLRRERPAIADVTDRGNRAMLAVDHDRAEADLHREHRAAGVLGEQLQAGAHRSDGRMTTVFGSSLRMGVPELHRHEVVDRRADEILHAAAEHRPRDRVGEQDLTVVGDQDHGVGAGVEERSGELGVVHSHWMLCRGPRVVVIVQAPPTRAPPQVAVGSGRGGAEVAVRCGGRTRSTGHRA